MIECSLKETFQLLFMLAYSRNYRVTDLWEVGEGGG